MEILYSPRFEREYKKLPLEIKKYAEAKESIFRQNPFDPRLKTHKLSGRLNTFWAFSITHEYRIVFDFSDTKTKQKVRFYRVGLHDIYDV